MDANKAYENFIKAVEAEAAKLPRPLEISQQALWAKAIVVKAVEGKRDDLATFRSGDLFGFTEGLVNQCIEFALGYARQGTSQDEKETEAWKRGYETARREFAKATGLYTEDDFDA